MIHAQSNGLMLWLLLAVAVVFFGCMLAEYLSRRWRYFWNLRRNEERLLPRFKTSSERLNTNRKAHGH